MSCRLSIALSLFAASLALSACSSPQGDFPSLAKRPYEKADPVSTPDPAPVVLTARLSDSQLLQTNALLARNRAAVAAYDRLLPAVQTVARGASGAANGSEAWVQAHMLLSRLDAARADGVATLAEVDRLIAVERDRGADAGLIGLLEAVQRGIAESVIGQNDQIDQLHRIIGR